MKMSRFIMTLTLIATLGISSAALAKEPPRPLPQREPVRAELKKPELPRTNPQDLRRPEPKGKPESHMAKPEPRRPEPPRPADHRGGLPGPDRRDRRDEHLVRRLADTVLKLLD